MSSALDRLRERVQLDAADHCPYCGCKTSDLALLLAVADAAQADLYTEAAWLALKDALAAINTQDTTP